MTARRKPKASRIRISVIIYLITLLVSGAFIHQAAKGDFSSTAFFYFNPDSPQSNLSRLKRDVENFFSEEGIPITFQPFAHLVDLERHIEKKPPAFLFVPRWYVNKYNHKLPLHPFLIPVRNGEISYRKILLGSNRADSDFTIIPNPSVAMTFMGPDKETMLNAILFSSIKATVGKINPIIVPKDSDALFALALGQVDMALVVKENIDLIAKINPNIMHTVCPLLESDPIPMPVLCFIEGVASTTDVRELTALFLEGKADEEQSIIMEMLQINGWQAINE